LIPEGARLRTAEPRDVVAIWGLVLELAAYERLSDAVDGTAERLSEHLFGPRPAAEALVAEVEDVVVGYALFFTTYSTFRTSPGLWMEDLYVTPPFRGQGLGQALFAQVAAIAVARGAARHEWSVLEWNAPAIGFYESLGAPVLSDWRICRLDGGALEKVAAQPTS